MALIPPFFLDCVTAIGLPGPDGNPRYTATGFLYGRFEKQEGPEEKLYRIYLVTNRHVFKDASIAYVRFNPEAEEPARQYDVQLLTADKKPAWFGHPDPEIDVAVVPINARLLKEQGIRFSFFSSDEHVATRAEALRLGLTEGDGVFVLGFPMGYVGEKRNFVIVRQGVLARVRDCLSGGSKEFLVDCSVFPGNSGGPVVSRPEVVSIQGTTAPSKAMLLGIVAGYVPYQDVAISLQTNRPRVIFEENSGLAAAFTIDYVAETIEGASAELPQQAKEKPISVDARANPDAK
ncbi:MAG: serine protease [candidate division NC10 bacterium]|nr:serine protease [candidate division NC10 bacterium]